MKTGAIFDSERAASRDAENISDEQDAASVLWNFERFTCDLYRVSERSPRSCDTPREPASEFKSEML